MVLGGSGGGWGQDRDGCRGPHSPLVAKEMISQATGPTAPGGPASTLASPGPVLSPFPGPSRCQGFCLPLLCLVPREAPQTPLQIPG